MSGEPINFEHTMGYPLSDPLHPLWKSENLRRAIHAAGVMLWSWNVTDDRFATDEHGFQLWGLEKSGEVKFEDLSAHIHPADRDRVRAAFTATRGIVGSYEIDFRIIVEDEIRWISARGIGDDTALHDGQMFGVFLDVTGRKQAEEGHELLAGEMSHRVKNLLAIAMGLTNITSQSTTTAKEMATELTGRLAALGRAHDLVRPFPANRARQPSWVTYFRYCLPLTRIWEPSAVAFALRYPVWESVKQLRPHWPSFSMSWRQTP